MLILGGHRGLGCTDHDFYLMKMRDFQENSVQSFLSAFESGASYVEFDVVVTKDLVPLVIHSVNPSEHFFESIPNDFLNKLNFEEIKTHKVGRFGEEISTLEEVLRELSDIKPNKTSWTINIELKGVIGTNQEFDGNSLCSSVFKTIEQSKFSESRILFSSFSLENLKIMRRLMPNSYYGLLLSNKYNVKDNYIDFRDELNYSTIPFNFVYIDKLDLEGIDYLHPETSTIYSDKIEKCKGRFGINAWTSFEEHSKGTIYQNIYNTKMASLFGVKYTLITDFVSELKIY